MSEKRVSVRLNATGGRQVRAELEGVGDAGCKAFGCLLRNVEREDANLAAVARRVAVARPRVSSTQSTCASEIEGFANGTPRT